jgi:hypothetical protein
MLFPRLEMVSACMHIICRPNEGFDYDIPIYTLDARSEEDTSAALMFANKHNVEVSIKTTGHSYPRKFYFTSFSAYLDAEVSQGW